MAETPGIAVMVVLGLAEQLERFGGWIGLFSVVGVAALAILAFAQARELKRLRDWAGTSPERLDELEERVESEIARSRSRGAGPVRPAPPPRPARPDGAPVRPPVRPNAPVRSGPPVRPATATGAVVASAPAAAPPTTVAAGGVADDAPLSTGDEPDLLRPPRPVPPRGAQAAARPAAVRSSALGPADADDPDADRSAGPPARRAGAIAGVSVVVAVMVVGVLFALGVLGGGGGEPAGGLASGPAPPRTDATAAARTDTAQQRSRVTVAVFNATQTSGLAKGAGDRLRDARYRVATVGDYTVGGARTAQGTSSVGFRGPGRVAAVDVAERLGLPDAAVRTATDDMRAAGRSADVIVILGADQVDEGTEASGTATAG